MKRINRYVLHQLAGPFLFFVFIFSGVLWLNQALRIVDIVISNGQSGLVFAELSIYLLPKVLETVVPVAAFATALYLTNRLYSESELVVFMGVGHGPANAIVPYLTFGAICFVLMGILTHFVTPMSTSRFQDRQYEISKQFLTQFITAGEFASPAAGVTVFFGEATQEGRLRDVLINDQRDSSTTITHTSASGQLITSENSPKLILFDGAIQRFSTEDRTLSTIQFDSLSFDLSQFAKDVGSRRVSASELFSWTLVSAKGYPNRLELHDRFVKSLLAIVVPVLGAIMLMSAGFSRNGFFLRIVLGVVFMVAINSSRGLVPDAAESGGWHWLAFYLPVFVAFAATFFMVRLGQAPWKSGMRGVAFPNRSPP